MRFLRRSDPSADGPRAVDTSRLDTVKFDADFARRCDAFVARLAHRRAGREAAGRASLLGPGEEFAGHRPYRHGEDLRRLDWDLYARLDKPFVRVERREAGERWTIWMDRSASMAVGPPGKLQRAAECGAALARVGLAAGARVKLVWSPGADAAPRSIALRRPGDWGGALAWMQGTQARGAAGLAALWSRERSDGDRLFGIGDFLDGESSGWFVHRRRGQRLAGVQWLAPEEFAPRVGRAVMVDPESGDQLPIDVDAAIVTRYERMLGEALDRWRATAARHGARHLVSSTAREFEDVLAPLLED